MTHSPPLQPESREALAEIEVGRTQVSRVGAMALGILFLAAIVAVPVIQWVFEWRHGQIARAYGIPLPKSAGFLHLVPTRAELADAAGAGGIRGFVERLGTVNARVLADLVAFEDSLEGDSIVVDAIVPPAQQIMTGWLGAGNEKVYRGRQGWLFYRPDVDYVVGAGFLEPGAMAARESSGSELGGPPGADPVKAIVEFAAMLRRRGIELIVLPAPPKSAIHPEYFWRKYEGIRGPLQNRSFADFTSRLDRAGVAVFDPAPALAGRGRVPAYLATDTHWTPEAVMATAKALAGFLTAEAGVSLGAEAMHTATRVEVTNAGDLAAMLEVPGVERSYPRETVTVRRIADRNGARWAPDPGAEILLLGDSFANIYSLGGMGWGESAGLAEQLSYELQRPVDAIRMNDHGSFATRQELDRRLGEGRDRLAGKRVVIYEFAARELAFGDWRTGYTFEVGTASRGKLRVTTGSRVVVRGTVEAAAKTPESGTVPYRDCVIAVRLRDVVATEGVFPDDTALVFVWGLLDERRQAAASWRAGDEVTLELVPWSMVAEEIGRYNRVELDDDAAVRWEPYWGVLAGTRPSAPAATDDSARAPQSADAVTAAPTRRGRAIDEFSAELAGRVEALAARGGMVLRGSEDWLFFRPELRHLSVGAFWGDAAESVSAAGNPEFADPLAAIVDFNEQLTAAGIELIVAPVPPKAVIYPDKISGRVALEKGRPPRLDAALQAFYGVLRDRGVEVLDLTDAMLSARADGTEMFCRQDSHFSGEACALFARGIAERLAGRAWLAGVPRTEFRVRVRRQEITGDLWRLLEDSTLEKEELALRFVELSGGTAGPVAPWRGSPVLLIGDSHCLVFHEGGDMHARGAGLPDLLAKDLGFTVDLAAVRGSGATPARMNLLRRGDHLAGKRVVVWCFAAREFTEAPGGWRPLPVVEP